MFEKLCLNMHKFVSVRFDTSRVPALLKDANFSHPVEITIKSVWRMSYIFVLFIEALRRVHNEIRNILSHTFHFDHFSEYIQVSTKPYSQKQHAF